MEEIENLSFISALIPLAIVIFIIAVGVVLLTQQFRKNIYRQKLEQEELKNLHQNELLISMIQVQEKERKRIGQDLHDELGALLSIVRMHTIQLHEKVEAGDEHILPRLQNIKDLIDNSLVSIRRISHELMPPQLEEFGLLKTLEAICTQINKTGEINIDLFSADNIPDLEWPVKLGLYRINMELINNTIKHAAATNISIQFTHQQNCILCEYSDNGKGIQDAELGKGLGQKGVRARVLALGGTFEAKRPADGGYYALINIKLNKS
jgi:signal transduction histidine kinase